MPSLADLGRNEAETETTFHGETIKFKYRPSFITSKNFDMIGGDQNHGLQKFICGAVSWWDITEKKGSKDVMIPLEVERVRDVPSALLHKIIDACARDSADVGEAASNSSAGS
jgi:hypothetical protein